MPKPESQNPKPAPPPDAYLDEEDSGAFEIARDWFDALIFAFVLAMFIRVFVVELFKIPTGSMTPTLVGDTVADVDVDHDGLKDLVVLSGGRDPLVFLNKGDRYEIAESARQYVRPSDMDEWRAQRLFHEEYDRILVNKFAYWLGPPRRGDVIVFKVPDSIWDPAKPIFIKRAAGLPGDTISFDGRLVANGRQVDSPEFFQRQRYAAKIDTAYSGFSAQPWVDYKPLGGSQRLISQARVPKDGVFAMGDNTNHSLDSRYWGEVPLDNLKGKAFIRYWPLKKLKFIH